MKLKRILALIIALAMALSLVPMAFAATAITPIDFETNAGDFSTNQGPVLDANFNIVGGIYEKDAEDMVGTVYSPQTSVNAQMNFKLRSYMSGIALTKSKSRVSFQIAAGDKNSVKAVSFSASSTAPTVALFSMETDGNMYVLGDSIGTYDVEKWYQIDIEFDKDGAYKAYVDGAETTGTSSADMKKIFGESTTEDSEARYLHYYSQSKASHSPSIMYIDNIEVEVSDATSDAAVPEGRKLIYTCTGTIENGMLTNLADGVTVEDIRAYFTVTAGSIKVVDSTGAQVTTGAVVPGMKVVLSSGNGLNVIEYGIDCLNLVFTVPGAGESTRELTKTISVTFNGAGTVKFYVNNSLVDTVSAAPYEYTIQHGNTSSAYTVKAVVVTAGDVPTETDTRSYDFVANAVPTIAFDALSIEEGKGVSSNDGSMIKVNATDSDYADSGVKEIVLYIDGQAKKTVTAEAYTETLTLEFSDFSSCERGPHSYYAVATDYDGATVQSAVMSFSIIESAVTELNYADFEDGSTGVWGEFNDPDYLEDVTNPAIREGTVKGYVNQTKQSQYLKNDTSFFSGVETLYWEMDFMTNKTDTDKTFLQVRGPRVTKEDGTQTEPQTRITIASLGVEAGKWYKVVYIVNCNTNEEKVEVYEYVTNENGVQTTSLVKNLTPQTATYALGSFASTRIYINETDNAAGDSYEFYMDNIRLYTINETYYVKDTGYDDTKNEFVISFNKDVEKFMFDKTNFKVKDANGKEVTTFDVSTSLYDVKLTFTGGIESQETYTVELLGIDKRLDGDIESSYTFTAPAKSFDVVKSEATVNTDGSGATITVKNVTGSAVTATVIYAVYSGDKLIKLGKQENVSFETGDTPFTVDPASDIGTGTDDLTAKVFVWSGVGAGRIVHTDVID